MEEPEQLPPGGWWNGIGFDFDPDSDSDFDPGIAIDSDD